MPELYHYLLKQECLREEAADIWSALLLHAAKNNIPYTQKEANDCAAVLWELSEIKDTVISDSNNNDEILNKIGTRLYELKAKAEALTG